MTSFVCTSFLVALVIFCGEAWVLSRLVVRVITKHPETAAIIRQLIASMFK